MGNKQGLIQIYTGPGKGKTTAACGLALRASAHKWKVCYISFHKDPKQSKPLYVCLKKNGITVHCFAQSHPLCSGKKNACFADLKKQCSRGLKFIEKIFKDNLYDLLIIDELNICVRDGFLPEKDVLKLMAEKPDNLELVLTGRGATKKMIKKADLVSFIKEIKHPFNQGIKARKGIEY
ncbi:MAG: cob(I)yrinic acid a,c-diamide adenosyltransferase [Candidatus Omnitrophica bacterium]|nr:cob(I)yrinic acid a,c-diamide adenosyltransferase [Candidatus Omnitrophota bacterium]